MLDNERYQNDGIIRHFEYDAIITGTSMTENFKTSECDELFNTKSIKIPFFGASFKEINNATAKAIDYNPNVKMVIRCLDTYRFLEDKDAMNYSDYPEYLYDENLLNDVNYLFNKDVLLEYVYPSVISTLRRLPSTTFDEYANWDKDANYGKNIVLNGYTTEESVVEQKRISDEEKRIVRETVEENILSVAKDNPNIDFYLFLPPYSIVYWDSLRIDGTMDKHLEAQRIAIEMMLEYDNIHLYSFLTDYDTVCNLDNYKDTVHYSGAINTKILRNMNADKYKLTKENCEDYFYEVYKFYSEYNYETIFE